MNISLTETQKSILIAAAERPDRRVEWFPDGVRGGARTQVLASLQSKGLVEIRDGQPILSHAGLAALGLPERPSEPVDATPPVPTENSAPDALTVRKTRENTKQAAVIALLKRPEGATLEQLVAATQWQKHTVRGHSPCSARNRG